MEDLEDMDEDWAMVTTLVSTAEDCMVIQCTEDMAMDTHTSMASDAKADG